MITQRKGNMESGAIVQELVQVHGKVASHIQLGGSHRFFRLRRTVGSREGCKVSVLITHRSRNRNKVGKVHLGTRTSSIAPFRIHIRKAQVIQPERTGIQLIFRGAGIGNNHKAHPVDTGNRRVTHQLQLFFAIATQVFFNSV